MEKIDSNFIALQELASRIEHDPNNTGWYLHRAYMLGQGFDLTAPRPVGRGFPLHGAEPKPLYAIQDLQALRGLTLPARQL